MFGKPEFYGSATVGERGQIVLPAELRKEFEIAPGDKLLVLGNKEMKGVMLVKAEVVGMLMEHMKDMTDLMKEMEAEKEE